MTTKEDKRFETFINQKYPGQKLTIIEWCTLFVLQFGDTPLLPPYLDLSEEQLAFFRAVVGDINGSGRKPMFQHNGYTSVGTIRNVFARIAAQKRVAMRRAARRQVNCGSPEEESNGAAI